MYNDIGNKIKTLTRIMTIIGMIIWVVVAIILGVAGRSFLLGLLIAVIGCVITWISSFLMYGFGELISRTSETQEDVEVIKEELYELTHSDKHHSHNQDYEDEKALEEEETRICPRCGSKAEIGQNFCRNCGSKL